MNGETRYQTARRQEALDRQAAAAESLARAEHAKVDELRRIGDLFAGLVARVERVEQRLGEETP